VLFAILLPINPGIRITGLRKGAGVTLTQLCGQVPDDSAPVDRLMTVNLYVRGTTNATFTVIVDAVTFVILKLSCNPEIDCGVTVKEGLFGG
jgi:hypothetical protein